MSETLLADSKRLAETVKTFFQERGFDKVIDSIDLATNGLPVLRYVGADGSLKLKPSAYINSELEYDLSFTRLSEGDIHFQSQCFVLKHKGSYWWVVDGGEMRYTANEDFLNAAYDASERLR